MLTGHKALFLVDRDAEDDLSRLLNKYRLQIEYCGLRPNKYRRHKRAALCVLKSMISGGLAFGIEAANQDMTGA
jgi:hypothetical protein